MRVYASDVDMPDVLISVRRRRAFADAVRVAASAFLAAQREIARFGFFVYGEAVNLEWDEEEEGEAPALQMPCFPTLKEFALTFRGVDLRLPTTGTFASGKPHQNELELHTMEGLKMLFLISQSLLSLRLIKILDLEQLVVMASELTEMQVDYAEQRVLVANISRSFFSKLELTVNKVADHWFSPTILNLLSRCYWVTKLSLQIVADHRELHWQDSSLGEIDYLSLPSQILKLSLVELPPSYLVLCEGHQSHCTRILKNFERIGTLHLEIPIAPVRLCREQRLLIVNINRLFFSELDLTVNKVVDHWFSPTILNLLSRCYWVTTLSLQIVADHREDENIGPSCDANCDCRTLQAWGDRRVGLDYLKRFAIKKWNSK
ncbi:hypothetical protein EJB05_12121, partial [Eragrostis curvula]